MTLQPPDDKANDGLALRVVLTGAASLDSSLTGHGGPMGSSITSNPDVDAFHNPLLRHEILHRENVGEVLDEFLFIAGARGASNAALMEKIGVTYFLCTAAEVPVPPHISSANETTSGPPQISTPYHFHRVPLADGSNTRLQKHFNEAFQFILDCERAHGKIVVYCREGKSRSASIVIAFLMKYRSMSYEQAFMHLRLSRNEIDPSIAFCQQLSTFGEDLEKQRSRTTTVSSSTTSDESFHDQPNRQLRSGHYENPSFRMTSPSLAAKLVQGIAATPSLHHTQTIVTQEPLPFPTFSPENADEDGSTISFAASYNVSHH